jgi:hypothetical protein
MDKSILLTQKQHDAIKYAIKAMQLERASTDVVTPRQIRALRSILQNAKVVVTDASPELAS